MTQQPTDVRTIPTGLDLYEDPAPQALESETDATVNTIVMMAKSGSARDAQKKSKK